MASTLMHLYAGNKIVAKHEEIADLPLFYLGCILPDWGDTKEIRRLSHLRSNDMNAWYKNNIDFYRRNAASVNNDLLLGYIIHNITDAAYDEHFNVKVRDFRFDYDQRNEVWWTNEVLPALNNADPMEINRINKILAAMYTSEIQVNMPDIQRIVDDSNASYPESAPVLVTIEMMDELSDIVYKIVTDAIQI